MHPQVTVATVSLFISTSFFSWSSFLLSPSPVQVHGLNKVLTEPTPPPPPITQNQVYTSSTPTYDTFFESLGQDLSNPTYIGLIFGVILTLNPVMSEIFLGSTIPRQMKHFWTIFLFHKSPRHSSKTLNGPQVTASCYWTLSRIVIWIFKSPFTVNYYILWTIIIATEAKLKEQ